MTNFRTIAARATGAGLLAASLSAGAGFAAQVDITVTNGQSAGGLYLTPLLSIFHDGTFDTFDAGARAGASLEALAEEGDGSQVVADVNAASPNFTTAVIANPSGFGGAPVLDPGEVTTLRVDLDPMTQRFFSFLSMVIPSNDTFIGNDDGMAYQIFDSMGNFSLTSDIVVTASNAWDAETEADDGNGAAFAPDTGTPATDTLGTVVGLSDLDFLIGRAQAPGGTVASASGTLATISFSQVAPIPLPAGAPLLLAGLGAFAALRKRRS